MDAVDVDIFVLNRDGAPLLAECLPSIVRAAAASRRRCRVTVVDNDSTDDSLEWLDREFPDVAVLRRPNDGLCSFNDAARQSSAPVLLLLNNDIKPAEDAVDPLVEPLLNPATAVPPEGEPIFLTAPRCYLFDGTTYEGFKTAVRLRRGLVQATALFPGCEHVAERPGPTASVGAAFAVDRRVFLELGGFDPSYLPGRIEDLDLCYRGFLAGYRAAYVPQAVALHRGCASFGPAFGRAGCDHLALRNTLLFQWKNLRRPEHRLRAAMWVPLRMARDVVQAPWVARERRWSFLRAYAAATAIWRRRTNVRTAPNLEREREFFRRHAPAELLRTVATDDPALAAWRRAEAERARGYPLSRHYLRPSAGKLAERLRATAARPWHFTLLGFVCAAAAAACLLGFAQGGILAALLILAAWFCDRTDGQLARLQGRASPFGAWLDANVDETIDLGLHAATAHVAAQLAGSMQPWAWLIAFYFGKYLLMHGLASGEELVERSERRARNATEQSAATSGPRRWLRAAYHLPGNADVRLHLLVVAVAAGRLVEELIFIACYYNLRWMVRYVLVARRMLRAAPAGAAA